MTVALTSMQRQIWAVQNLFPGTPLYNTAWRFDLGAVDAARFEAGFHQLVAHTDALRMTVADVDGAPDVRLGPGFAGRFEVIAGLTAAQVDAQIAERVQRPLDMARAPVDAVLYDCGSDGAVWFLNLHHIVNDGLSGMVLFQAMAQFYAGGAPEPMPSFFELIERGGPAPRSEDRAHWDAWRKTASPLPRLYGSTLPGTGAVASERRVTLTPSQLDAMAALGKDRSFASLGRSQSLFNTFQTVLTAWTHRVSGEEQLAIGVATHGRATPDARKMAGCFVDIVPVDATVPEAETFRGLHTHLRHSNKTAFRHAAPGAFQSQGAARFSVVLNCFTAQFPEFDGSPVTATWLGNGHTDPTHALRLNVIDGGAGGDVTLKLLFNADVVPEAQADAATAQVMALFDAFLADPDARIDHVPLAQPGDASVVLARPVAEADPVEDVVTAATRLATLAPDALLVRDDTRRWTRAEIMARADAIADHIRACDLGPGSRIGVHLGRSGDLVAALLGILKVGATFIPLDPGQPGGRLDAIAVEAQLHLVLTEAATKRDWAEPVAQSLLGDLPLAGPPMDADPDPRAAYVLFTSGSTGRPKGVQVGRAALSRYAHWAQATHAPRADASWALHSAIGFDLTLTSIFAPLVSGGHIRAYAADAVGPDLSILRVFAEDAVDVVKLTPRHLTLALQDAGPLGTIRSLVLGGEELTTALARKTLDTCGSQIAIHNEYGPTEAVVGCMDHLFDPQRDTAATVPIGRPAAHTQITVRDAGFNPAPDRVVGEIYVGGPDRLAHGYFGQGDATRAVFVTDPATGQKLYRTGDLGSVRPDGVVLYHGRADAQLKLSGIRIEPAEISDAVLAVPGISGCAVTLFDPSARPQRHCPTCGISDRVPDVGFTEDGQCHLCRDFDRYRARARDYFGEVSDLHPIIADAAARKTGKYDCVILLSGGKDSTYAVAQMAEITPNMLCVTLDNGYIAEEAKANIRRTVAKLGLDHRFLSTPAMNDIFVDSLNRFSNVCQGCFKTIYTLSLDVAREVGAPIIVTGLSRGQLFETRLAPELFKDDDTLPQEIDDIVLEARRTYHAFPDAVSTQLNGNLFDQGDILSEIGFVDFYRYCDVPVSEVYRYLGEVVDWTRPTETGRSTNCLINDAGIFVHKAQRQHHNYALPYSWDVRMGHKTVDECLAELDDEIDEDRVHEILEEIGYDGALAADKPDELTCYYVSPSGVTPEDLRNALAQRLPREAVPRHLVPVDEITLNANGKVDFDRLPVPHKGASKIFAPAPARAGASAAEVQLLGIWQAVLETPDLTAEDNFYDVGGTSIGAIQIAARARAAGIDISPVDIFRTQTVATLAAGVQPTAAPKPKVKVKAKVADTDRAKLAGLLRKQRV